MHIISWTVSENRDPKEKLRSLSQNCRLWANMHFCHPELLQTILL